MTQPPSGGDPRFGPADGFYEPNRTNRVEERGGDPVLPTIDATTTAHQSFGQNVPGFAAGPGGFVVAAPSAARGAALPGTTARASGTGAPRWVLPVVGIVVLALLAGFFVWVRDGEAKSKAGADVFRHTTVATPASIGDLALGVGPGVDSANTRASLALAAAGILTPVAGGYVDGDQNAVAYVAAGKRVTKPAGFSSEATRAANAFATGLGAGSDSAPITLAAEPAGPLGGTLQCGAVTVSGTPATYCVAVDEGAVVTVLLAATDQDQAAATALTLRNAVETRTS